MYRSRDLGTDRTNGNSHGQEGREVDEVVHASGRASWCVRWAAVQRRRALLEARQDAAAQRLIDSRAPKVDEMKRVEESGKGRTVG